jgi:predicted ArsR family transcriptional regulator
MKMTVNQLADVLGVEYIVASSLIKLLELRGLVTQEAVKQKPKNATGRGKPSTIYNIPKVVELNLHDMDEIVDVVLTVVSPEPIELVQDEPIIVNESPISVEDALTYVDC